EQVVAHQGAIGVGPAERDAVKRGNPGNRTGTGVVVVGPHQVVTARVLHCHHRQRRDVELRADRECGYATGTGHQRGRCKDPNHGRKTGGRFSRKAEKASRASSETSRWRKTPASRWMAARISSRTGSR